jgi:hypothetical protein
VRGVHRPAGVVPVQLVAELAEQGLQLRPAAVDVADDVERTGDVAVVVEQALAHDLRLGDVLLGAQDVHLAEPLLAEVPEPAAQLVALAADHLRPEVAVRADGVALDAEALGHVEDDRDRQDVVRAGQGDEVAARLGLHVRGVDDREAAGVQALAGDVVQDVEGGRRGGLVVLVVGDEPAAEVAGDRLEGAEVRLSERRLARAAGADEDDERQLRNREPHATLRKTASWVGGPTSGSSSPTGTWRTA